VDLEAKMGESPASFPGGQIGIQEIDGIVIVVQPWQSSILNPTSTPLLTPDAGANPTPVNDSDVTNNPTAPQIGAETAPYVQPNVSNPHDNSQVDESSAGGAIPVSAIAVEEGVNYVQPSTAAPTNNPAIGVPSGNFKNPMGL
jgi:hypothetical protein